MAITPKPAGTIAVPNTLGSEAAVPIAIPNNLTEKAAVDIAVPNTLTSEAAVPIGLPNTLTSEAAVDVAVPNTLTSKAVANVAVPNTLSAEAAAAIAVPSTLNAVTAAEFPRTLTPLVDINFACQCYSQSGSPILFDDLFTYTRSSTATFINRAAKPTGGYDYFVDTAAIDELRFEFNPETNDNLGALIEDASTNLTLNSAEFDNANWIKSNLTVTANYAESPDNTVSADRLINGVGNNRVQQAYALTAGTHSLSSFLKKDSAENIFSLEILNAALSIIHKAQFNLSNGTIDSDTGISATIKLIKNDWYRCSISGAVDTENITIRIRVGAATGTDSATGLVWGAQVEALPFASSYIATSGSAASRVADLLSLPTSVFNSDGDLTVSFTYDAFFVNGGSGLSRYAYRSQVDFGNSYFRLDAFNVRNTTQGDAVISSGAVTDNNTEVFTSVFESLSNVLSTFIDGAVITQADTGLPLVLTSGGNTFIGASFAANANLWGHISKIKTYEQALTAQEVSLL